MSVNSKIKATKIIGQRKVLYRQRIPEAGCARKETVDINIFAIFRNGDRKIMQPIWITLKPPSRIMLGKIPVIILDIISAIKKSSKIGKDKKSDIYFCFF